MTYASIEPTVIPILVWNCGHNPSVKGNDGKHAIHDELKILMKKSRADDDRRNAIYAPFRRYVIKHIFSAELDILSISPELLILQEIGPSFNLPFIGKNLLLSSTVEKVPWESVVTTPKKQDQMKQLNQIKGTGIIWNRDYKIIGTYDERFPKNNEGAASDSSQNALHRSKPILDEVLKRRLACTVIEIDGISILICSYHGINRSGNEYNEEEEEKAATEAAAAAKEEDNDDDEDDDDKAEDEKKIDSSIKKKSKITSRGMMELEEKKRLFIQFLNAIGELANEKADGNIVIGIDTNLCGTNVKEFLEGKRKANELNYDYDVYQEKLAAIVWRSKLKEFNLRNESKRVINREQVIKSAIKKLRQKFMSNKDISEAINESNLKYIFDHTPLYIQIEIYSNQDEAKMFNEAKRIIDPSMEELTKAFKENLKLSKCFYSIYLLQRSTI